MAIKMFTTLQFNVPTNWIRALMIMSLSTIAITIISQHKTVEFLTVADESSSSTARSRLFRVIVLTYDRAASLAKLLASLNHLHFVPGDKAVLEIWMDSSKHGDIDNATLNVANNFKWILGPSHVIVHAKHVGIYGQWLTTWHPEPGSREVVLILEDDMTVSPYAYLWLRAAHDQYDHRSDISGYTLQSEGVNRANGWGPLIVSSSQSVFGYQLLGSWGFSPHADRWRELQQWYNNTSRDPTFKPYVKKASMITAWYKGLEKQHKADSMWTMWHIYFSDKNKLYCVYNNLARYSSQNNTMLAVNRKEKGLHFGSKQKDHVGQLLTSWDKTFVNFSSELQLFDWDGRHVR